MNKIILFLLIPLFLFSGVYVRDGGTGDGSAWNNALDQIPSPISRDDTVYIADGSYTGYTFDDALSGGTYIYVRKATATAHGSSIGWDAGYGDGVSVFTTRWNFTTGYYDIDGLVGSDTSGHGFRIDIDSGSDVKHIYSTSGGDNVKIRHLECEGVGMDRSDSRDDIVYVLGSSTGWEFSYCWFHDTNRTCMLTVSVSQCTLEYSVFQERHTNGSTHGELVSINSSGENSGWVIRHNKFIDNAGTGFLVIKDAVQGGFEIYGNLFYNTSSSYGVSNGAICNTTNDTNNDMEIYNNTFVDIETFAAGGIWFHNGSDNYAYNNLFYNIENCGFNSTTHDYNWFYTSGSQSETNIQNGESDIFTNYGTDDFTLAYATNDGIDLGFPYNVDLLGNTRGEDDIWDRGVFEFTGEDVTPPTATGNLTANGYDSMNIVIMSISADCDTLIAYYPDSTTVLDTLLTTANWDTTVAASGTDSLYYWAIDDSSNVTSKTFMDAETVPNQPGGAIMTPGGVGILVNTGTGKIK